MAIASVSLVVTTVGGSRLLGLGDVALVWANTVSMGLRGLYAGWFVQRYCASRGYPNMMNWRALLPSLGVMVAFAAAAICTRWSEAAYDGVRLSVMAQKGHIAVGGVCLVACLLSWCVVFSLQMDSYSILTTQQLHLGASPVCRDCLHLGATVVT